MGSTVPVAARWMSAAAERRIKVHKVRGQNAARVEIITTPTITTKEK